MSNKQSVLTFLEQYGSCSISHMMDNVRPQLNKDELRYALKTLKEDKLIADNGSIWSLSRNSFTAVLNSRLWDSALFA